MKLSIRSAALALALAGAASAANYAIDPVHSSVRFGVRHMVVSTTHGRFDAFAGTVAYDPANPSAATIDVTIQAASIDTDNAKRDAHLRSPDFFDVEKFPTLTFRSKSVAPAGEGRLRVVGELTIHGVTKDVVLDVTGPSAPQPAHGGGILRGASATTTINRKDFGLTWNKALEAGGWAVGEEIRIEIDLELREEPAAEPPTAAAPASGG